MSERRTRAVDQEPVTWARTASHERPDRQRVVVTSWGLASSLDVGVNATFARAAKAESGIDRISRFDPDGLHCQIGGQVHTDRLAAPSEDDRWAGSAWRLLRTVAMEADVNAACRDVADRSRIALVFGGHGATPQTAECELHARYQDASRTIDLAALAADPRLDGAQRTRRMPEVPLLRLASMVDARGPVIPIVSACAAGTQAIGEAMQMLRADEADVVLAGGTEPFLNYTYVIGFSLLGALTRRNPSPQEASRPFDRKRNGFVIAEGAGLVVLERLSDAKARGRPILGEVLGYGASGDGFRITDMHPKGNGATAAMQGALRDAQLHPNDVGYINAHGTSTALNDPIETLAIKRVLGEHAYATPISSNKSMIGHTIGSAGAIEAILTMRGMAEGLVLPTRNLDQPDRKCDLDYVPHEARVHAHQVALSNSFGFGGQNGCLCLGVAP